VKQRLERVLEDYGWIAVGIYLSTLVIGMVGFSIAIRWGFEVEGVGAEVGTLAAAYAATKALTPLRILVTLALAPPIGAVWHRIRGIEKKPAAELQPDPSRPAE
jgi:hypothetical protein